MTRSKKSSLCLLKRTAVKCFPLVIVLVVFLAYSTSHGAETVITKDGRIYAGRIGQVNSLSEAIIGPTALVPRITFIDDQLRRTFVGRINIARVIPGEAGAKTELIKIKQDVCGAGMVLGSISKPLRVTPFDQYGRRIYEIQIGNIKGGRYSVLQGITEITPNWTKVESLKKRREKVRQLTWSTRIATSSIPPETLNKILRTRINMKDPDERLKIIRFYIESDRYKEALAELKSILESFPKLDNRKDLKDIQRSIKQLQSRRALKEIELRRSVGQYALAYNMLKQFPLDGVAGAIRLKVNDEIKKLEAILAGIAKIKKDFNRILDSVEDSAFKLKMKPIREEIFAELNHHNYARMADFRLFVDDKTLKPKQKIALAISGWVLGSNEGITKARAALVLYDVRNMVKKYLVSETLPQRQRILDEIARYDDASIANVAKIIAQMKPPVETPAQPKLDQGTFQITVPAANAGDPPVHYFVHLPPEYSPYRRYPAIVTLQGQGNTPEQQLQWWAGAVNKGVKMRLGQATRNGYIVIVPDWTVKGQTAATFSFNEHKAVLFSLRDAFRRFSINTDKVFLTGHSMGGDLAWDIGLAHPDLWAGVIPISARCKAKSNVKYSYRTARYLPTYFVTGELDGKKTFMNAENAWNKYFMTGFNTTVVEYIGRGHEHYHDEITRIFDWMNRRERNFFPNKFDLRSYREMDNFFWWIELKRMAKKRTEIAASYHQLKKGIDVQNVRLHTNAKQATLWLSPKMVDFNRPIKIVSPLTARSRKRPIVEPKLSVLLEDARTRADRQHPFWARVDLP